MAKVTRLVYHINGSKDYTIDLARDLSVVHRKLHRQKQTYTVLGGQVLESNGSTFYFKTAPPAWTTNVAIRRAFNTWRKVHREVYKNSGLTSPKWSDFKLRLDVNHELENTLVPCLDVQEDKSVLYKPYTMGEWNYSTIVQPKLIDPDNDGGLEFDADADSWDMHIVGEMFGTGLTVTDHAIPQSFLANITSVGVINSWYNSRSLPDPAVPDNAPFGSATDPTGVRTDPLSNLFNVQDDDGEQVSVIESENDQAPYSYTNVPGMSNGELQLAAFTDNSQGTGSGADVQIVPGFQAPCGLIRVKPVGNNGAVLMLDVLTEGERI